SDQRTLGFSIQHVLIGIGAVIVSALPYVLSNWFDVSNVSESGVPYNVVLSFIIGAAVLVGCILITVSTTKEYTPEELKQFDKEEIAVTEEKTSLLNIISDFTKMPETMRQLSWVQFFSWFGLFGMWVFSVPSIALHMCGSPLSDSSSAQIQASGVCVSILFAIYNLISAIFAFFLSFIAKKLGRNSTHSVSLIIAGLGLISIYFA